MELIVISQTHMKIMLTETDMRRFDLTADTESCVSGRTRDSLRRLFDEARMETGFETEGARLLVQLFACRSGGCEIFVTKLGEPEADDPLSPPEEALLRRVFREDGERERPVDPPRPHLPSVPAVRPITMILPDLTTLLSLCRRLDHLDYRQESRAYILDDDRCCLCLSVPVASAFHLPLTYAFLQEYGEERDAEDSMMYLAEHGKLLCDGNAVHELGCLA